MRLFVYAHIEPYRMLVSSCVPRCLLLLVGLVLGGEGGGNVVLGKVLNLPPEYQRAYDLIDVQGKALEAFSTVSSYISSQEKKGVEIDPEMYGRYAEMFVRLGGSHYGDRNVREEEVRVARAAHIFLEHSQAGDRRNAALALQVLSDVMLATRRVEEGAALKRHLHNEFLDTKRSFECPAHKSTNFSVVERVTQDVQRSIVGGEEVEVWNFDDLSFERFEERFLKPRAVVNVRGVTKNWPANDLWTWYRLPDLFREVGNFPSWWNATFCSQSYISSDFFELHPEHLNGKYTIPHYFDKDEDISYVLGRRLRLLYSRFMVFSHRGGGAGFHKDAYDQSFWNICVFGRKKWIVFPPDLTPEELFMVSGQFLNPNAVDDVPLGQIEWFQKVYPRLPFWNISWYEVDQGEGDMIYIPAGGFWHSVISFTDTVSISFNMLNKYDYKVSMASLCKRGERLGDSIRACNILGEMKPRWFEDSCCARFVEHPEDFPFMDPRHHVFPGLTTSVGEVI